jgi:alpha-beta hydrolase superfamily lysophospholipase
MARNKGFSDRTRIKYRFKQDDFDFFFQWIMGGQTNGGAEAGECFFVASEIQEGDTDSWFAAWTALAKRVEARAKTSLERGHLVSARESFLRAYSYYRAPLLFMDPKDSRYCKIYKMARVCFRQAAKLHTPPIEEITIPFEGSSLAGYLLKPDNDPGPRKTLLMFGGGDSFVEDLYLYIGPAGLKRDYNVFIVDLPGQGILPHNKLCMRADSEVPMKAIVDFVLNYEQVDPERVAAFGISAGGYLIPRAVTAEKRIKACIVSSVILSFHEVWTRNTALERVAKMENSRFFDLLKRLPFRKVQVISKLVDTYTWRWGVNSVTDLIEVSAQFVFNPRDISCPTLVLIGQQEYERFEASREWAHRYINEVSSANKKLVITPQNEGADGHAIGTNLSLMSQLVFDWLDEVFEA